MKGKKKTGCNYDDNIWEEWAEKIDPYFRSSTSNKGPVASVLGVEIFLHVALNHLCRWEVTGEEEEEEVTEELLNVNFDVGF